MVLRSEAMTAEEVLRAENFRGAGYMLIAMAAFTIGDAVMKLVAGMMPLYQAVTLRGLIAVPLLLLIARMTGGLRLDSLARSWRPAGLRTLGEVGATLFFFLALVNLPLATVSAINQSVPLGVTAGAALFFGEKVGWRRMLAILAGFFGVLLIVRPGAEGMNIYALCSLASVSFVVLRDLATRKLAGDVSSVAVALSATLAITLVAAAISLPQGWRPVPLAAWPYILSASVLVLVGYIFVVRMMRVGQVAAITPFRYSALLWALVLGWLIWGHVPDALTALGALIVVASGLFALLREARLGGAPPGERK